MAKTLKIEDLYRYTGDISQVFYARQYSMSGGKTEGLRAVDIHNGTGMECTILADRCMDIGHLSFNGLNFAHISKTGYVSPQYYDNNGLAGLKSFTAGFLTTCGLNNVGSPCEFDSEEHGIHGRISNTPAEEFCVKTDLSNDIPVIRVEGIMRDAALLGANLRLSRSIEIRYGENKIRLTDIVENRGFKRQPLMLLYHFNIGYPLLNKGVKFYTSYEFERSRDQMEEQDIKERFEFPEPIIDYTEQCFYYRKLSDVTDRDSKSFAAVWNKNIYLGAAIFWDSYALPRLTHWKNPKVGDYVMGIEPCNCMVEGVKTQFEKYGLEYIEPMQKKTISLEIAILEEHDLDIIKHKSNHLKEVDK